MANNNLDDVSKIREFTDHSMFGDSLMIPNMDKSDGNRGVMAIGVFQQMLILENPELPKVFSRFENQIASYSRMIKYAEDDLFIYKVFTYTDQRKLYLCQNKRTKELIKYDVTAGFNFTEKYGFKWINDILKFKEKDVIPKGTLLQRATCFDELGNYMYGTNLKTMYMPWEGMTYEDPFVISASAKEKLTHNYYYTVDVPINSNDIIKNILGDSDEYKGFADIGEHIKDDVLCAIHRVSYENISATSDKAMRSIHPNDDVYKAKGKIVDIEIFSNLGEEELEKLSKYKYFSQIKKYMSPKQSEYINLIAKLKEKGVKLHDDVNYDLAHHLFKDGRDWTYNGNEFDTAVIRFTILKTQSALNGTKITSR